MNCWSVVDDLKMLSEKLHCMTKDEAGEYLDSFSKIYQLKFEYLFDIFSKLIEESKI